MGKGMKHYTEDGLYNGKTHKMDDGSLHTGKTHTKSSKVVSHKKEGPFKLREVNSPMKCWKKYKQVVYKKKGGRTVPNCVPK
jgi:hypothetical protein